MRAMFMPALIICTSLGISRETGPVTQTVSLKLKRQYFVLTDGTDNASLTMKWWLRVNVKRTERVQA